MSDSMRPHERLVCGHAYPDGLRCNRPKATCQLHTEPGAADGPHVVRTVDRREGREVVTFEPTGAADQKAEPVIEVKRESIPGPVKFEALPPAPTLHPTPALDRECSEMGLDKLPSSVNPESDSVAAYVMSAVQSDIAAAVKPLQERILWDYIDGLTGKLTINGLGTPRQGVPRITEDEWRRICAAVEALRKERERG